MKYIFVSFLCILSSLASNIVETPSSLILTPNSTFSGAHSVFVFIPGALVKPSQYIQLIEKIQAKAGKSGVNLWVAVPKFSFDIWIVDSQIESHVKATMKEVVTQMKGENVYSAAVKIFYGGHSRGCSSLQTVLNGWLSAKNKLMFQAQESSDLEENIFYEHEIAGFVWMACSLNRAFRNSELANVPSVTIGSELDGLYRIFRVAEEFYFQISHRSDGLSKEEGFLKNPVFVLRGGSHQSYFAGEPSFFVNYNDIKPEVSKDEGFDLIAEYTSGFLVYTLTGFEGPKQNLLNLASSMESYFTVIVNSLVLEGSYHLKPACSEVSCPGQPCWEGSPWTEAMQVSVGNLSQIQFEVVDSFYKVWLIPFHLPKIINNCSMPDNTCHLKSKTVTELAYDFIDGLDSGFSRSSSDEMKTKMSSRQSVQNSAGIQIANFTILDDYNYFCAELNQKAINWALKNADPMAKQRYFEKGAKIQVGEDKGPYVGGVQWIWEPLAFEKGGEHGSRTYTIRSPTMRTPVNYIVPMAAGFHYCKLLSPARALEWIYTDSLKSNN